LRKKNENTKFKKKRGEKEGLESNKRKKSQIIKKRARNLKWKEK